MRHEHETVISRVAKTECPRWMRKLRGKGVCEADIEEILQDALTAFFRHLDKENLIHNESAFFTCCVKSQLFRYWGKISRSPVQYVAPEDIAEFEVLVLQSNAVLFFADKQLLQSAIEKVLSEKRADAYENYKKVYNEMLGVFFPDEEVHAANEVKEKKNTKEQTDEELIAEKAGLSRGTVNRALRDLRNVLEESNQDLSS